MCGGHLWTDSRVWLVCILCCVASGHTMLGIQQVGIQCSAYNIQCSAYNALCIVILKHSLHANRDQQAGVVEGAKMKILAAAALLILFVFYVLTFQGFSLYEILSLLLSFLHTHRHQHIRTHSHLHSYAPIHNFYFCPYIQTFTHPYKTHTHMHAYTHTHIHSYTNFYPHTHTHTRTLWHTHTKSRSGGVDGVDRKLENGLRSLFVSAPAPFLRG